MRPLVSRCGCARRAVPPGRDGAPGPRLRGGRARSIRASSTARSRVRPGRPARRRGRPRHQLHRSDRPARAAAGPADRPVVPPALVADIAGGTIAGGDQHPARRCASAMRPARGAISISRWRTRCSPSPGTRSRSGRRPGTFPARASCGSPAARRATSSIRPRDGKLVACGALEQKFWLAFCDAIGLAGAADQRPADPDATKAAVAADHRRRDRRALAAEVRRGRLLRHHRGVARGGAGRPAFRRARPVCPSRRRASGKTMPALPLPIAQTLRAPAGPKPRRGSVRTMICSNAPLVPGSINALFTS